MDLTDNISFLAQSESLAKQNRPWQPVWTPQCACTHAGMVVIGQQIASLTGLTNLTAEDEAQEFIKSEWDKIMTPETLDLGPPMLHLLDRSKQPLG